MPSLDGNSEEEEEEENGGLPDLNDKKDEEDEEDGGLPDVDGEGKKAPGVEGDGTDENEGGGLSVRRLRKPSVSSRRRRP